MKPVNTYTELKKVSATFDKGFNAVKTLVDRWGHSKKPIKKMMETILTGDSPSKLVTDLSFAQAYLYLFSEFFQDPKAIKQLKTTYEAELTPEAYQALSFWQKSPAFWLYFSVKEELDDDVWAIVDNLTGEEHILCSHGISIMQRWEEAKDMRYICLMMPNGQCLQSAGAIKYNKMPVSDFHYYCSLFKPEVGLKAIMSKHFPAFWQVDLIATKPIIKHKSYAMGFLWQPFTLPDFDSTKLPGKWVTMTLGTQQKFYIETVESIVDDLPNIQLFRNETAIMTGCFVRDTCTGEMSIVANTEFAYPFYAAILERTYPSVNLPKQPSVHISAALRWLSGEVDLPFPWKKFIPLIELKKDKEPDFVQEMQGLYSKLEAIYMQAIMTGEGLDMDAIAKATKLDKKTAKMLFGGYDDFVGGKPFGEHPEFKDDSEARSEYGIFTLDPKDMEFQLTGWQMPKDVDGGYLFGGLYHSDLFAIKDEEEAYRQLVQLTNEAYAQELDRYGVCTNIEALFEETFDEDLVYPLMNTFFWLLYHKGNEWLPVRSYAIEMLKWIPSSILREYVEYEDFIEDFSRFTKKLLCTKGICSLTKRPTTEEIKKGMYSIKGTGAFYSLLQVLEDA